MMCKCCHLASPVLGAVSCCSLLCVEYVHFKKFDSEIYEMENLLVRERACSLFCLFLHSTWYMYTVWTIKYVRSVHFSVSSSPFAIETHTRTHNHTKEAFHFDSHRRGCQFINYRVWEWAEKKCAPAEFAHAERLYFNIFRLYCFMFPAKSCLPFEQKWYLKSFCVCSCMCCIHKFLKLRLFASSSQ